MSQCLNKKDLKSLKDTLGKQGISLEKFQEAQITPSPVTDSGVLHIDTYSFGDSELGSSSKTENGWYVGYGVQYNGVGISKDDNDTSESEEETVNDCALKEESSGFSSDPPTDEECQSSSQTKRISSEEGSDDGQLLYGVPSRNSEKPDLYLNKTYNYVPSKLIDSVSQKATSFENATVTQTCRFPTKKKEVPEKEHENGYQMIGMEAQYHEVDENIDKRDEKQSVAESSSSSGLWTNFIINLEDLKSQPEENDRKDNEKIKISNEKSSTIPLDQEKLSQISAAMANFSLPTPPGWENIDDQKLISFIKQRLS